MESLVAFILPVVLLLARVTAFFAVLPLFSWDAVPVQVRAGMAVMVALFLAIAAPPALAPAVAVAAAGWLSGVILVVREALCGLALGMTANLVFLAVQQGGRIVGLQMGLSDAEIIDPTSQEDPSDSIGLMLEMVFAMFFLVAGGHRVLLAIIARSYQAFPMGSMPTPGALAGGLVQAGSAMLLFGLKLAAPLVAAFLVLAVVLAVLARVMPEMNILMDSFPMRIGLGLFMAAALMPTLDRVTAELAGWMNTHL